MSEEPRDKPGAPVRRAGAGDAPVVARLLHDFNAEYDDPTPPVPVLAERVAELLAAEQIVVLLAGDPPLGLALFRRRPSLRSSAADAYLEELYVVPERRGEGIGRALLEAAIDAARAARRRPLRADDRGDGRRSARPLRESRPHQPRRLAQRAADALLRDRPLIASPGRRIEHYGRNAVEIR